MERNHARFSGGAGVRTHPLSDEDYRREMNKLSRADDTGETYNLTEEEMDELYEQFVGEER